jgi:hypothetical protein
VNAEALGSLIRIPATINQYLNHLIPVFEQALATPRHAIRLNGH